MLLHETLAYTPPPPYLHWKVKKKPPVNWTLVCGDTSRTKKWNTNRGWWWWWMRRPLRAQPPNLGTSSPAGQTTDLLKCNDQDAVRHFSFFSSSSSPCIVRLQKSSSPSPASGREYEDHTNEIGVVDRQCLKEGQRCLVTNVRATLRGSERRRRGRRK